jgi:hypothetical protein
MAKDQPFPTNRGLGVCLLKWLNHNFVFEWFNILECPRPIAKWMPQMENSSFNGVHITCTLYIVINLGNVTSKNQNLIHAVPLINFSW